MTLANFYERLNYTLRGVDDDAPTHGGDEASYWLDTLNRKKDELYEDVSKNWYNVYKVTSPDEPGTVATAGTTTLTGTNTYFADYKAGDTILVDGETSRTIDTIASDTSLTVTVAFSNTASGLSFTHQSIIASGVQQYSLHRSLIAPSDNFIVTSATNTIKLDSTYHNERNDEVQQVYISGDNPKLLNFTVDIESTDQMVGGVLSVAGYYMPADIANETDVLPFLDSNWAVMAVASEIAFNDIVFEDKAPDLNAKANALYSQMIRKNRLQIHGTPRQLKTVVTRITGY